MKRKEFLKLISTGTGMLTLSPALLGCRSEVGGELAVPDNAFSRPLSFPQEIRAAEFELAAETTQRKLAGGVDSDVIPLTVLFRPQPSGSHEEKPSTLIFRTGLTRRVFSTGTG